MILICVALTLAVAVPLLLAGNVWYMAQYSLAGLPLAIGAWLSTRQRSTRRQRTSAAMLLVASFPLAIWVGQLPTSVAWVRLFGRRGGGGLWLGDVNAESLYVGFCVAAMIAAATVALALRVQTGQLPWRSFLLGALGACLGLGIVYAVFRPGSLNGAIMQSISLAVWLAVLSVQWAVGFRAAEPH